MATNDDHNEDWLRTRSWDLPTTVEELRELFPDRDLRALLHLPAAEAMPEALRREIEALPPPMKVDDHQP